MKTTTNDKFLYLDDNRIPLEDKWFVVHNYDEFVQWIHKHGVPHTVSFDHDLTHSHSLDYFSGKQEEYEYWNDHLKSENTGLDCLKWLAQWCVTEEIDFPHHINLHTHNYFGKVAMEKFLNSLGDSCVSLSGRNMNIISIGPDRITTSRIPFKDLRDIKMEKMKETIRCLLNVVNNEISINDDIRNMVTESLLY